MQEKYSYFRDPRALAEIRKHKWLESQKQGREIGFASAAVDWIKKYGEEWKKIHARGNTDKSLFIERREYRRFKLDGIIELIKDKMVFLADAIDVNVFGLACKTNECLPVGYNITARLRYERNAQKNLFCRGTIDRIIPLGQKNYELFLRFDERSQEEIEGWEYLRKIFK